MPSLYFPHGDFGPACDALNPNQVVRSTDPDIPEPVPPSASVKPTCPIFQILNQYRPSGFFGPVCDVSWPDLDPSCVRDDGPTEYESALSALQDVFSFELPDQLAADPETFYKFGLRCKYDPVLDYYFDCEVEGTGWDPCIIAYGRWKGTNICSRLKQDFDIPPRFVYAKPPFEPRYCVDFDPPENVVEYSEIGVKRYIAYPRSEPPTYPVNSKHWKEDVNEYAVWTNPMICNMHGVLQDVTYNIAFPTSSGSVEVPLSKPRTYAVSHSGWSSFFQTYGVFVDTGNTTRNWNNTSWEVEWKVDLPADGDYTINAVGDNAVNLYLDTSPFGLQYYYPTNCSGQSCWDPVTWTTALTGGAKILKAEVTNFNDGDDWSTNPTGIAITIHDSLGNMVWNTRMAIGTATQTYSNEYTMLLAGDDDVQVLLNNELIISATGCSACHGFKGQVPAQLSGVPSKLYLWDPNTNQWNVATSGTYPDVTASSLTYFDDERQYWHDWFSANPTRGFVEVLCKLGNIENFNNIGPITAGARGVYVCNGCGLNGYGGTDIVTPTSGTGFNGKVTIRADRYTKTNGDYGARIYLTRWTTFGYNYQNGDVYQLIYTDSSENDLIMGYVKLDEVVTDSFNLKASINEYVTVGITNATAGINTMRVKTLNTGGLGQNWVSYYPANNLSEYDAVGMSVVNQTAGPIQSSTEHRGFDVPGDGWKYIMTGDWGNSFVKNRSIKFIADTRNSSSIRFWVRAGSDENGHERPNNEEEGLRVELNKGAGINRTVQIVPSWRGSGLGTAARYEEKYGSWHTVEVKLESDERLQNLEVILKSKASNPPEYRGSEYDGQYPNGGDIYGIYRVDLGGGAAGFIGDQGSYWDSNPGCWAVKLYGGPDFSNNASGIPLKIGVHQFHPNRNPTKKVTYENGSWTGDYLEFEHGNTTFTTGVANQTFTQDYTLGDGGLKIRLQVKAVCGNTNCSEMDSELAVVSVLEQGYGYQAGDEFTLTFNNGNKSGGSFTDFSVYIAEVTSESSGGNMFWNTRDATGFDKYPMP